MTRPQTTRLLIFLATITFIVTGTIFTIRYAKGYRPTSAGTIKGTGLLAANSFPNGAEVYINDKLTSATDTTLNLDPEKYLVEIKKDGFFTWSKTLTIKEELVTQTNATLFPTSPALQPLTFTGAVNPVPSSDGNKIVFTVASASATTKNGLYVQDLSSSPISVNKSARQIARNTTEYNYSNATYTWSPNTSQILISFKNNSNILLEADRFNDSSGITDVTVRLPQIFREWEEELARTERVKLAKLPEFFQPLVTLSSSSSPSLTNLYFSPDGEKILYQATDNFSIPQGLVPELPSSSTQSETREVIASNWYVYDLKEDKNFFLSIGTLPSPVASPNLNSKTPEKILFSPTKLALLEDLKPLPPVELASSPSAYKRLQNNYSIPESISLFNAQYSSIYVDDIQWFPDSTHLIISTKTGIDVVEYDATNRTTLYAGPFDSSFVYPWPDGSRLITLIQFSPDVSPNLYTIKLK
ncbi:MAG: PEGA domain-containing protein [bacterium]